MVHFTHSTEYLFIWVAMSWSATSIATTLVLRHFLMVNGSLSPYDFTITGFMNAILITLNIKDKYKNEIPLFRTTTLSLRRSWESYRERAVTSSASDDVTTSVEVTKEVTENSKPLSLTDVQTITNTLTESDVFVTNATPSVTPTPQTSTPVINTVGGQCELYLPAPPPPPPAPPRSPRSRSGTSWTPHSDRKKFGVNPTLVDVHQKVAFYGTFISCLAICGMLWTDLILRLGHDGLGWLDYSFCSCAFRITNSFYVVGKTSMFAVFVARLELGFRNSFFAYPKRVIIALYGLVSVIGVVYMTLALILSEGEKMRTVSLRTQRESKQYHSCRFQMPILFISGLVLADFLGNVLVSALFIRALNALFSDMEDEDHSHDLCRSPQNEMDAEMRTMPLKYALMAVATTAITIIHVTITGITRVGLLHLDCVVNILCLLLMTKLWKPVYVWLGIPLLQCFLKCQMCDNEKNSTRDNHNDNDEERTESTVERSKSEKMTRNERLSDLLELIVSSNDFRMHHWKNMNSNRKNDNDNRSTNSMESNSQTRNTNNEFEP